MFNIKNGLLLIYATMTVLFSISVGADNAVKFNFINSPAQPMLLRLAEILNTRLITDSEIIGKVWIQNPDPVTAETALDQAAVALEMLGYGLSFEDGKILIFSLKNLKMYRFESYELPIPSRPLRLATLKYKVKNNPAEEFTKLLVDAVLSPAGTISINSSLNEIVITDFSNNLNEAYRLLTEFDRVLIISDKKEITRGNVQLLRKPMKPPVVQPKAKIESSEIHPDALIRENALKKVEQMYENERKKKNSKDSQKDQGP